MPDPRVLPVRRDPPGLRELTVPMVPKAHRVQMEPTVRPGHRDLRVLTVRMVPMGQPVRRVPKGLKVPRAIPGIRRI